MRWQCSMCSFCFAIHDEGGSTEELGQPTMCVSVVRVGGAGLIPSTVARIQAVLPLSWLHVGNGGNKTAKMYLADVHVN